MINIDENCNPEQKILVFGLSNSGKTSIILSFKGVCNLLSYYSLKPTKGIDINEIEDPFTHNKFFVWDFGGQDLFRQSHLGDFDKLSHGACKLIYVIDSQDIKKYEAAYNFLKDIMKFPFTKNLDILVYLHKYDPEIELDADHIVNKKLGKLIPRLHDLLKDGWKYKMFKTSIFTQFRKLET